jgi:hypothetical protein
MSSKAEVLAQINNTSTYIGTKVKELVNSVHCEERTEPPKKWKRGDVIRVRINLTSDKARPSVVIKVTKDYLVSIPLTSGEDVNTLCPSTGSRFFKDGNFCNSYVVTTVSYSNENYIGIYDSPKSLNNAVKELKNYINANI